MFERILVPLDGSHLAEAALPPALAIATQFRSKLVLLQVIPFDLVDATAEAESPVKMQAEDLERRGANEYLTHLVNELASSHVAAEAKVIEAAPAEAILDCVKTEDIGLIVMSTHGRGGLGRLVFGSVADQLLRRSRVPVLVIRPAPDGA
jgi:nucleotide-binding universal stress UspA family protein